jgi:hypothetical protein
MKQSPILYQYSGEWRNGRSGRYFNVLANGRLEHCADGAESTSHYRASGLAAVGFWVTSRRKVLVLSPRARVHQSTMGEAMKIDE